MIKRIVKMTFRPEETTNFEALFAEYRDRIAAVPGCLSVELLRDTNDSRIFFTLSIWEHPDFLEQYRKSEIFGEVWPRTKALFMLPPEAWTVRQSAI